MKENSDEDSAIEDPNTESMKSVRPQVFPVTVNRASISPPTRMPGEKTQAQSLMPGISQLRTSKSPGFVKELINQIECISAVRNLFPETGRTQSRSSTLVDAESLQGSSVADKTPTFQPLPLDLSETPSQLEVPERTEEKQSLQDKVSDFLARLHQDSINLSLDIPKPRPFPGRTNHSLLHGWIFFTGLPLGIPRLALKSRIRILFTINN